VSGALLVPNLLYGGFGYERLGDDSYPISLAIAGFGPDDIAVTAEQTVLTIEGQKAEKEQREYLYRSISARDFKLVQSILTFRDRLSSRKTLQLGSPERKGEVARSDPIERHAIRQFTGRDNRIELTTTRCKRWYQRTKSKRATRLCRPVNGTW
jgi:hypothetical protein